MSANHLRLSELNAKISDAISGNFAGLKFWVVADVTNHSYKEDKQSHYFQLVEKSEYSNSIIAKISGKAFGNGSVRLAEFGKNTGQQFTNNIRVLILVTVEFHPMFGLSVSVVDIDTNFTLGVLQQQRMETLARLTAANDFIMQSGENYVTTNNRLQLNVVIQRIAVISSTNSAGHEDFRHTLSSNNFGYTFQIDEYFTNVQGESNGKLFYETILSVFQSKVQYDAVVITRGGGAQTDFLIFDDYNIARAVAKFPIPVITGIGHHKNISLIDLMAHTNTKTPTKAAEFIIAHNRVFEENIILLRKNIIEKSQKLLAVKNRDLLIVQNLIVNNSRDIIANDSSELQLINQKIISFTQNSIFKHKTVLANATSILRSQPKNILNNRRNSLNNSISQLKNSHVLFNKNKLASLDNYSKLVKIMSPENILKKGYAIIKLDGKITGSSDEINVGNTITILVSTKEITATVTNKKTNYGKDTNL